MAVTLATLCGCLSFQSCTILFPVAILVGISLTSRSGAVLVHVALGPAGHAPLNKGSIWSMHWRVGAYVDKMYLAPVHLEAVILATTLHRCDEFFDVTPVRTYE